MEDDPYLGIAREILVGALGVVNPDLAERVSHAENVGKAVKRAFSQGTESQLEAQVSTSIERIADGLKHRYSTYGSFDLQPIRRVVELTLSQQRLTRQDLLNANLDPTFLYNSLRPSLKRKCLAESFSGHQEQISKDLLRETCTYLIFLARGTPDLLNAVTLETFVRTKALEKNLTQIIDDLKRSIIATSSQISVFESNLRQATIYQHAYMDLFGIDVDPVLRRQRIDLAHIALSARISLSDARSQLAQSAIGALASYGFREFNGSLISQPSPLDRTLRQIEDARAAAGARGDWKQRLRYMDTSGNSQIIEVPVHRRTLAIITGQAGAGKSTVCQWLATRIARSETEGLPASLSSSSPLLVKLRRAFAGKRTPTLEDLVRLAGISDQQMPNGWIIDRLEGGKVVVILDGLDELTQPQRSEAMNLIEQIVETYPDAPVIVTSRTDDAPLGTFHAMGFFHLTLESLSTDASLECANRWFLSMKDVSPNDLHSAFLRLTEDIRTNISIRELAQTPLLVSLLCAYYAHSADGVATTRGELYDRVVSVLLDRRDRDRGSIPNEWAALRLHDKAVLLQAIAGASAASVNGRLSLRTYMAIGGSSEIETASDSLATVLTRALEQMPNAFTTAPEVIPFLLTRSTLLIPAGRSEAQFVHRSFQEYFYAKWLCDVPAREVDVALLTASDSGRSVLSFLAHFAESRISNAVLTTLCETYEGRPRRTLAILIAEFLGNAVKLDKSAIALAREIVETIIPPRTHLEAKDLATQGPMALSWLEKWLLRNAFVSADLAVPALHLCGMVGGASAVQVIHMVLARTDISPTILQELVQIWPSLKAIGYEANVLNEAYAKTELPLRVPGWASTQLKDLNSVRTLDIEALESISDLTALPSPHQVRTLYIRSAPTIQSLSGLSTLERLSRLHLGSVPGLSSLRQEEIQNLSHLSMVSAHRITTIEGLRWGQKLRCLEVPGLRAQNFDFISKCRNLRTLDLSGSTVFSTTVLENLERLSVLNLGGCVTSTMKFSGIPNLKKLFAPDNFDAQWLSEPLHLETFASNGYVPLSELQRVVNPNSLKTLLLGEMSSDRSARSLAEVVPRLNRLALTDVGEAGSLDWLGDLTELTELTVKSDNLESLAGLERLGKLKVLDVKDCERLHDFEMIWELRDLEKIYVGAGQATHLESLPRPLPPGLELIADEFWMVGHGGA